MFRAFQILGGLTLALAGSYLAVMAYFHAGRPQPTTDFMVELNRPMRETPEEDKAWPIYRTAWIQYGFSDGGKMDLSALFHPDDSKRPGRLIRPGDPGWPAAVARLDELQGLLDTFRLGTSDRHSAWNCKPIFPGTPTRTLPHCSRAANGDQKTRFGTKAKIWTTERPNCWINVSLAFCCRISSRFAKPHEFSLWIPAGR